MCQVLLAAANCVPTTPVVIIGLGLKVLHLVLGMSDVSSKPPMPIKLRIMGRPLDLSFL
jgi:hypothetical protein